MTTAEIINEIYKNGGENQAEEVLKILMEQMIELKNTYLDKCRERGASLRTIHKINKGKNEAIDSLSEVYE